jgi:sporulation protein YlmC with PRC-barrel domain
MSGLENVSQWRGQDIVGSDGDKIGKLEEVYVDTETDEPVFGAVQVGMIGKHRWAFVPLEGASVGQDHLQVHADKKQVKDAPSIEPKGELARQQEEDIYGYYGMSYQPPSGASGRRLARR